MVTVEVEVEVGMEVEGEVEVEVKVKKVVDGGGGTSGGRGGGYWLEKILKEMVPRFRFRLENSDAVGQGRQSRSGSWIIMEQEKALNAELCVPCDKAIEV